MGIGGCFYFRGSAARGLRFRFPHARPAGQSALPSSSREVRCRARIFSQI